MVGAISEQTSRAVYDDALRAYADPGHPCHAFRPLQPEVPDAEWQLPEPFNGASADAGIVFLGLNPSYDPREPVPRIGTPRPCAGVLLNGRGRQTVQLSSAVIGREMLG